jgi:hypothetical protein
MLKAHWTNQPPSLDGSLASPPWAESERSPLFVDMETGNPALLQTEAAVLWDQDRLYCGFWVQEPYPTASLTERDSIIFLENDVELFIDGGDCYYELEINALGAIYEVFFIWKDAFHRFDSQTFDVHHPRAYTFGGDFDRTPATFWDGTHPRGIRWAFRDWDMPGLEVRTHVEGTLNSQESPSVGWTAEIAIPWASLAILSNGRTVPPEPGDIWKMFLGRFQQLPIGSRNVQAAWCVSPHGKYDTHMPERFTPIQFLRPD